LFSTDLLERLEKIKPANKDLSEFVSDILEDYVEDIQADKDI